MVDSAIDRSRGAHCEPQRHFRGPTRRSKGICGRYCLISHRSRVLGSNLTGAASLTADVRGTESAPRSAEFLRGRDPPRLLGAEHVEAEVSAGTDGPLDSLTRGSSLPQKAGPRDMTPEGVAVRARSAATSTGRSEVIVARDESAVDLTRLSAESAGLALSGAGQITEKRRQSKDSCIYRSPTSALLRLRRSSACRLASAHSRCRAEGHDRFAAARRLDESIAHRDFRRRRIARRCGDHDRHSPPRCRGHVDRGRVRHRGRGSNLSVTAV